MIYHFLSAYWVCIYSIYQGLFVHNRVSHALNQLIVGNMPIAIFSGMQTKYISFSLPICYVDRLIALWKVLISVPLMPRFLVSTFVTCVNKLTLVHLSSFYSNPLLCNMDSVSKW